MKLTGSMRYDKAQNFIGNVSPRVSLVLFREKAEDIILEDPFQTGFRNPTTQDQYIFYMAQ
jgi:outer membrane receptor for ferrienterochelin and colicin